MPRIFGPDGSPMGDNIDPEDEGLVTAELDMGAITIAKCFGDPVGHYSRPDATALLWNQQNQQPTRPMVPTAGAEDVPPDAPLPGAETSLSGTVAES